MSFKCTLWPSGEVLELNGEETLLGQLKKSGKKIKSSCGGCATCGDCVIVVKSGEMNLSPQSFEELRLLGNVFHITKERLSCQTKVTGDVTIDISGHEKNTFTGKGEKPSVSKSTTTRLKKREDIEKAVRENEEKTPEKPGDTWYRHWEKEGEDSGKPKKLGGNKRPRAFNFTDSDNEDNKKN
ncbi:MAG: 2Fe-2S iron-sulfur cluster-binding protein [Bacteriovoracaceae bacterium]